MSVNQSCICRYSQNTMLASHIPGQGVGNIQQTINQVAVCSHVVFKYNVPMNIYITPLYII